MVTWKPGLPLEAMKTLEISSEVSRKTRVKNTLGTGVIGGLPFRYPHVDLKPLPLAYIHRKDLSGETQECTWIQVYVHGCWKEVCNTPFPGPPPEIKEMAQIVTKFLEDLEREESSETIESLDASLRMIGTMDADIGKLRRALESPEVFKAAQEFRDLYKETVSDSPRMRRILAARRS